MSPVADTTRSVSERRILEAARRRFERFGYRRTSIAEIAHDAGIAVGTVYRYFKTKEEIFFQVVEDLNATWLAQARQVLHEPGTPTERLARIGPASVKFNQENKLLSSILNRDTEMVSAALLDQIAEELLEQNVSMMAAVIREGVEEGTMRPVDPEKAAFILFVTGQTLFNQEHHPYEDLMPLLAEIILEGLLPR
jgi:AcrR family transcriptional regulator